MLPCDSARNSGQNGPCPVSGCFTSASNPEHPQNNPRTTPEHPQNTSECFRTLEKASSGCCLEYLDSRAYQNHQLSFFWLWSSLSPSCPNSTRCSFDPKKLKKTLISGPRNGNPKTMPECTPPSCPSQLLHIYIYIYTYMYIYMYVFVHTSTCIHTYIYVCVEHLYIHVGRGTPLTTPSSTYR